jgi:excisionase family DNA binding protein
MQRVYTTGQVARVFNVNINTVIKWFDEGKLEGFRLPRSNERRIYRASVTSFMEEHGISPDLLHEFDEQRSKRRRGRRAGGEQEQKTGRELRAFPRVPVDLDAALTLPDSEQVVAQVQVKNLSLGGAYLTGFRIDGNSIPQQFQLRVGENGSGPRVDSACELIHLRKADDQTYAFGVRFTSIDPGTLQRYMVAA